MSWCFRPPYVEMEPVLGFAEASPKSLISPETSYSGPQVRALHIECPYSVTARLGLENM